jgi:hypothetical protein
MYVDYPILPPPTIWNCTVKYCTNVERTDIAFSFLDKVDFINFSTFIYSSLNLLVVYRLCILMGMGAKEDAYLCNGKLVWMLYFFNVL